MCSLFGFVSHGFEKATARKEITRRWRCIEKISCARFFACFKQWPTNLLFCVYSAISFFVPTCSYTRSLNIFNSLVFSNTFSLGKCNQGMCYFLLEHLRFRLKNVCVHENVNKSFCSFSLNLYCNTLYYLVTEPLKRSSYASETPTTKLKTLIPSRKN